jgi:hypothetical protein
MKPLVNKKYKLERFNGKGGWTYALIPEVKPDKNNTFGWMKVKGTIDHYEIKKSRLAPMGNGKLFLPVKAEIRKKIGKKEGDYVKIVLYPDSDPIEIPEDLQLCLEDEPKALAFFHRLSESEQMFYIQWITEAKRMETKVDRLSKTVDRLARGLKRYDRE